jgi:HK97 family phage major capsid protein
MNTPLSPHAGLRPFSALARFNYDKPVAGGDTVAGGAGPDVTATITKGLDDINKRFDDVPSKSDVTALNTKVVELEQTVKAIRVHPGEDRVYERVQDDPKLGFNSVGHYLMEVHKAGENAIPHDERLKFLQKAPTGASVADSASLGYTIPPAFNNMIWDGMNKEPDNLFGRTDQYTVPGETLEFLANAETSRATGSRWGAIQGYWLSEAGTITASKPKLRKVKIEPQELGGLVYLTDKLLARSPVALTQLVNKAVTSELLFMANDAIINGTGAGQPQGVLNAACTVSVSKETGQAAATVVTQNIDKMWSRLHPRSRGSAAWFINVDVEPQLQQLVQEVGTGGIPLYRPPGGLSDAPFGALKGRPVIPIEFCATLGTVGDILLLDLGAYITGVYGDGIKTAASMHVKFVNAETAFRFMYAVDGQPWLAAAITPYKGSNTLSPFVSLATRA